MAALTFLVAIADIVVPRKAPVDQHVLVPAAEPRSA
jgi:hypothetical protein